MSMKHLPSSPQQYRLLMVGLKALPEAEYKAKVRTLCRTDLYFLLRFILGRPDIEKQWLFERCREVQNDPNGFLDLWAREHYKSTIITFALTIQDILASHGDDKLRPETTFGIFSHTRPNAKGFLKQIKREFEANEILKDLFPDILYQDPAKQSPKWSEDEGIIVKRETNPKEATVEAWGVVDGQPTGKHFGVLIYDDVVTAENVTTPDMINKTTDMLGLSYNLGAEGGHKRFIGTYYHFNDTYHTIQKRGTVIPRIKPCTDDGTETGAPVLLSEESIKAKRRDQGPYIFSCQMLLNPKGDDAQGFKDEWIRYYDTLNLKGLNIYLLFDPANEKKKSNDYTCGFVIGLGSDENIRIIDCVRDRLNLSERTRLIMNWHRKYKPIRDGVRYEKIGMQSDIEHVKTVQEQENYSFEINPVGGTVAKNDRIKRLMPYFEQGRILMPRSLYYTDYQGNTLDLIQVFIDQEYKAFPVPVHDDMLDCLARLIEPDLPLVWPKEKPMNKMGMQTAGSHGWMG